MNNVQAGFVRFMAAIALVALSAAMFGAFRPAAAETVQESCTHDAFRLCSDTIPDVTRTKACLARNRSNLSAVCKSAFSSGRSYGRHRRQHR
jgi:hypothetical protein